MREECPDRTSCLHLVASAGSSKAETGGDWSRLDGGFRRFPLGIRKVGHIAATGESVEVSDLGASDWIDRSDWAQREGIRGFMGQPLLCRGDILGVLAIFMRIRPVPEVVTWLRTIADHVAAGLRDIFERALTASRPDSPRTDLPPTRRERTGDRHRNSDRCRDETSRTVNHSRRPSPNRMEDLRSRQCIGTSGA